jgi:DNA-binding transcriptional ArsR family regulator
MSLTEGTSISRQAISKHLRALSDVGIIVGEKSGRECLWQFQPKRLGDVLSYLEQISAEWDRSIERLRAFVEDEES